jgi:disulfide bond formation protein DsbB
MKLACSRSLFFTLFIAGALALGVSYYLEYTVGLKPCGLCLLQRLCLALLTGVCLIGAVHGPGRGGWLLFCLVWLCSRRAGAGAAGRQMCLDSHPARQRGPCVPDLTDMFASAPWACFVRLMFKGTIDCGQVAWTLFDLSIPEWSLLFFVAMMILGIYQLLRLIRISVQRHQSPMVITIGLSHLSDSNYPPHAPVPEKPAPRLACQRRLFAHWDCLPDVPIAPVRQVYRTGSQCRTSVSQCPQPGRYCTKNTSQPA